MKLLLRHYVLIGMSFLKTKTKENLSYEIMYMISKVIMLRIYCIQSIS